MRPRRPIGDQIKAIWAADDAMMLGAIEATKQAGRCDIKFASDGIYPPTIDSPHPPITRELAAPSAGSSAYV